MTLNPVHDLQCVYRKLLTAMSRPGHIENIQAIGQKINFNINLNGNLTALLMSLLDGEVSFCFISKANKASERQINLLTYAQVKSPQEADYVIIPADCSQADLQQTFSELKIGTLANPHDSATLILNVDKIEQGNQYLLRGPGIKTENSINIHTNIDWCTLREFKTKEFPLGLDFILLDLTGNIICIPRTTLVVRQEDANGLCCCKGW